MKTARTTHYTGALPFMEDAVVNGAHRLLLLACSRQKRSDEGLLTAIERYNGPAYRVLRRFRRMSASQPAGRSLAVYILSARFGLVTDDQLLPLYDQRLTGQRIQALQSMVGPQLETILTSRPPAEVYIHAGHDYLETLQICQALREPSLRVIIATGTPGKRLADLYRWLYSDTPPATQPSQQPQPTHRQKRAILCGVEIVLTSTEALTTIRQSLHMQAQDSAAFRCHSWYAEVDQWRISPKWCASQLTNLPVSRFHTDAAVRALRSLGIEVKRQ